MFHVLNYIIRDLIFMITKRIIRNCKSNYHRHVNKQKQKQRKDEQFPTNTYRDNKD